MFERVRSLSDESSVRTRRQPSTVRCSSAAICSMVALALAAASGSVGQEGVADRVRALPGQVEVDVLAQEGVGDLQQDAGTVTGLRVRAGGTAVVEIAERLQALGDDRMARYAAQRRDEGDTARVVLERGVVEALGLRQTPLSGTQLSWHKLPSSKPVTEMALTLGHGSRALVGALSRACGTTLAQKLSQD